MPYAVAMSEENNIGSLQAVSLAHKSWFSGFSPVSFFEGNDWLGMDFLPESASCKDSSTDTVNGPQFSYSLVFAFNRQNKAMYDAFLPYLGMTGIIQFTDNNDLTRIIGTPGNPVTIKQDADTGQQYNSLNFYKITVTWVSCVPAVVV